MQHSKIAIIGAGVSGLAAAVRLSESGFRGITLFEARREAGGRTRSFLDPKTGDTLDNGQHLLMGCYTATLDYLDRIGTSRLIERIPLRIPFWSQTGVRSFTIDRTLAPPLNLLSAIMRTSMLTLAEKRSAANLGNALWRNKLPSDLPNLTCAELFKRFEQAASLCEKLWEPIVFATLNASTEQASAVLFTSVIREAFFSSRKASALLIPKCGLSELLIDPATALLERHGALTRLSDPVRNIEIEATGIRIVTDSDEQVFDRVVNCTNGLQGSNHTTGPATQYSPIVNAYFWLDRTIFNAPIQAFVGMTLQWAFPKASMFSAQRVALTVSAADAIVDKSNEEITSLLWSDLVRTVPSARDAQLMHAQIIREKRATPLFSPNVQMTRPLSTTDDKRFILAGDFVQNGLPATIEGAIRNGYAAADIAIADAARKMKDY
ncbi:MAG: hydroxysqualene dehydroxylase HpnE [Bacteroidota bacterium]|nr:hydroxysqualene dehydroxylase HpnE [Bacteroidota bacterium]MDP4233352.1 hydroxysqualene dehydroxylase HpnE [Bacteroidota bacterium]MDP4242219.1 hydroxysqualene dehydroxylase HpnE [Bacteroidota bacterium]MDP4286975.1 hydroxysqualene dehydroxylase HpnE [Bacteroidota bacterium]